MNYIIYSPPYNENIGGVIVLHKLCHCINASGGTAFIHPYAGVIKRGNRSLLRFVASLGLNMFRMPRQRLLNLIEFASCHSNGFSFMEFYKKSFELLVLQFPGEKPFNVNDVFNTPITLKDPNSDSIVVYPEIISGNPLGGSFVVRWFLHKPGFHTGEINYGPNELYFFQQGIFNNHVINPNTENLLTLSHIMTETYCDKQYTNRSGCCYILRKGKNRAAEIDPAKDIVIDGKSHSEIAEIFNRVEYCISYDMETTYSFYAVLCGCKSVVVPIESVSKEEWQPKIEYRYGIAYGMDDLEEAEATKHLLLPYLRTQEKNQMSMIESFMNKCENYFE